MSGEPSTSRAVLTGNSVVFRSITEVAENLGVPQHVLRFWETKFLEIKPIKRNGGRRYYRPEDVELIGSIKEMLYSQGFTIRGVQKFLKEKTRGSMVRAMVAAPQIPSTIAPLPAVNFPVAKGSFSPEINAELQGILLELKALKEIVARSGLI